ncbi:MAG: hypothetical protein AB7L13_13590 [Acidimicrobiia bacterium]
MSDRFVLAGLAGARSQWFRDLGRLATSGALPIEFVRCVSGEELRSRVASGRAFSAMIVDASTGVVDRDLVDMTRATGAAVVVVDDRPGTRDWQTIGVTAVLPATFTPEHLLDVLQQRTRVIRRGETGSSGPVPVTARRGKIIAVTGAGGVGSSTAAMAIAQGMATGRPPGTVVLADLTLHGELAVLHGTPDVVPGLPELVEAHRAARLDTVAAKSFVFDIADRRYHLLLGLRRHRDWAALRPRAFEAAFATLASTYDVVVCDSDPDVEGQDTTGSIEVEERNLMARTAMANADIAAVVGLGSTKGMHSLVRTIGDLVDLGVAPERVVAVVNNAPRRPDQRARIQRSLHELCQPFCADGSSIGAVVFLPFHRHLEHAVRDITRLPGPLPERVAKAVEALLARQPAVDERATTGVAIRPGSLGLA